MKDMFPRVGRWRRGYQPKQVDAFLERARLSYESAQGSKEDTVSEEDVRAAAFDIVVDGYSTAHVDASLDRLEAALVRRRRTEFVKAASEDEWVSKAVDRATTLYPRLQRPKGERFADARGQGYAKDEVDRLCERLIDYFENGTPISAQQIRLYTFPAARGTSAYDEAVVDSFLDRAVEVLLAVE
ncbi:MAG TPA: DivIVA domain-containing protein [Actinomycetaceae bacterium]|nr:DivIVA domain-containing protein [Actinomycetaceae bacterium]